jgi:hypothetical protein
MEQATGIQSARERMGTVQDAPTTQDNTPRFFVQFGREVLYTDCAGIPGKVLRRGDITPLTGYQKVAHINTIPEGSIVAGSRIADKDGNHVWARELVYAGPEADRLVDLEAKAGDRKDGIVEIKTLRNRLDEWRTLDFNLIFFPDGIPATHSATLAHLLAKETELKKQMHASVPSHLSVLVLGVLAETIEAVRVVDKIHHDRIEMTHRQMKLSPDDGSGMYKKAYDDVDEEILLRTEKPRFDQSADMTARALELLSKNTTSGSSGDSGILSALVEQNAMMREQMAAQTAALTKALERLSGTPEPPKETPPAQSTQVQEQRQPRRSPFTDK